MSVASVPVSWMAEALFTQMSMPPNFCAVCSTAAITEASSRTSTLRGSALPPEEGAEHVDRPLGLTYQLAQARKSALVAADQVVDPGVQAEERIVVGRQHQHLVRDSRLDARERRQPLGERIAVGLGREYRD